MDYPQDGPQPSEAVLSFVRALARLAAAEDFARQSADGLGFDESEDVFEVEGHDSDRQVDYRNDG